MERATFSMMLRQTPGIRSVPSTMGHSPTPKLCTVMEMSTRVSSKRDASTEGADFSGKMGQSMRESTNATKNMEGGL